MQKEVHKIKFHDVLVIISGPFPFVDSLGFY
jgi:hypothetical protein